MIKVGAHVSAAVSLELSFERARDIGAECTQIFISPPQQWAQVDHPEEEIEKYKQTSQESGIGPNFIHGAYLINLASQNPLTLQKSIDWLIYSQNMADKLGIEGTIFHIGSSGEMDREKAIDQVIKAIQTILQARREKPLRLRSGSKTCEAKLILETSAGAGNTIGDEFFEIGQIIKNIKDTRVKVCLDTQHIYASGYDLKTIAGLDKVIAEFDQEIGLDKLVVIHVNDSKTEKGSRKDRHENLGEGFIGLEGFRHIVNHPAFKDLPFILEVPGEGSGPDKNNLNRFRSLILDA